MHIPVYNMWTLPYDIARALRHYPEMLHYVATCGHLNPVLSKVLAPITS